MAEMKAETELVNVSPDSLLGKVTELKASGYRLVQICSTRLKKEERYELTYSFSLEYDLLNLRFTIGEGVKVPSISHIFPSAFFYENEIHDLFGVPVEFMTVDYKGTLYRTAIPTPFK